MCVFPLPPYIPFKFSHGPLGSAVSFRSGSGPSPAAKHFWCTFRLKSLRCLYIRETTETLTDYKGLNHTYAYMQKLTHFKQIDVTKFLRGRFGGIAPTTFE